MSTYDKLLINLNKFYSIIQTMDNDVFEVWVENDVIIII